ncbi:HpcH/HpaI aldolase family protein [Paenibacillus plantarum]|nr:aldolase/citrate lyase family protein [Paenibacillus plantarum]
MLSGKKKLIGTFLSELYSPNIPVLFKSCGFDYFVVDCEHGCFDYGEVAALSAVSKQVRIPMLVRISSNSRDHILKYMDMGVAGLLVPMVSTSDEIRQVVEYAKYEPWGKRGITTKRAHSNYKCDDILAYMEQANQETVVLAQIETAEGLKNIKQIAETVGLDGLIVGPTDLTSDLGIAMQFESKIFRDAVHRIYQHASDAGKLSGMIISNTNVLRDCERLGMQILCWNSELGMLMKGAELGLKELRS